MISVFSTEIGNFELTYDENALISLLPTSSPCTSLNSPFAISVKTQVSEYLSLKRSYFDICYRLDGSDFFKNVMSLVAKIPYGQTQTYKEIAIKLGSEKLARAVGRACSQNKLLLIIPCHRVVGNNNSLVGYRGGLSLKKFLLELENNSDEFNP